MNSNQESKKRKNSTYIPPQDLTESTDVNPSPKKKNKIPVEALPTSSITERKNYIGGILTLPEVYDGVIRQGEVKNVRIFCTVTENRIGRTVSSVAERSGNRFICVADCTGFIDLNMDATKVGIRKYDTPCGDCTDETRNFFNAFVTGHISWHPNNKSPDVPIFFLNNGSIEKIELDAWSGDRRFMLPTTDVCRQMVKSEFGGRALFGTTGICGRVNHADENGAGVVVMSLDDPVGYSAIEIHPVRDDETAKSLIRDSNIAKGTYLFVNGNLDVYNFPHHDNAILRMCSTDGTITVVGESSYLDYVTRLRRIDVSFFSGIEPEEMSPSDSDENIVCLS